MGYFNRLKDKWEISSNRQFWIIFIVFGLTGSSSVKVARPFLDYIGLTPTAFESLPLGCHLLVPTNCGNIPHISSITAWVWRTFLSIQLFWEFEKKIYRRMGLKRFFPEP